MLKFINCTYNDLFRNLDYLVFDNFLTNTLNSNNIKINMIFLELKNDQDEHQFNENELLISSHVL